MRHAPTRSSGMRWLRRAATAAGAALLMAGFAVPAAASTDSTGETYTIATDTTYAPFEFTDASGDLVGIDMDLIRAIAEDQGFEVEIEQLGFDAALQALQANQVEGVIAGMSITDERRQTFDFSEPYFTGGIQLGVLDPAITSFDDLEGSRVAVKTGTIGQDFAESIADEYGFSTTPYQDTTDMVEAVRAGQAVGYFEDYPVLAYGINQGSGFTAVGEPEPAGDYGFAVNKGQNAELLEMFNTGLQNLQASGEYDEILDTYIGTEADAAAEEQTIFTVLGAAWPALMEGLGLTLASTLLAVAIAFILGTLFGFARLSTIAPLRWFATAYVYVFRGTPILIQAFFVFFALPQLITPLLPGDERFTLDPFTAGIITLSLNTGAYMTEIIRGGIQAVDPGQAEASRSLGIGHWKTMERVVLPQALRIMLPSFVNQGIITLKDTSLLMVIGLAELTFVSRQLIASTYMSAQILLVVGLMYLVVISLLTLLANRLEKRINA